VYERFTDRARKVMQLAHRQATCRYSPELASEHILLGLFEEGSGVAANVLRRLDVDWPKLWAAASGCCKLNPPPANIAPAERPRTGWNATINSFWQLLSGRKRARLPLAAESSRLIECAMQEARALGHNYVGTEHLLLGLLHQPNTLAAQLLVEQGVTLDGVRREVLGLIGHT
jgi:ATP-dependent Clp protease ATP-binding subunit ClpC